MRTATETPGKEPDPKSFLEFAAALIERKFADGRLYDIEPDTVKAIIHALKVVDPGKNSDAPALRLEAENMCYAALQARKEKEYLYYITMLLPIAKKIKAFLQTMNG